MLHSLQLSSGLRQTGWLAAVPVILRVIDCDRQTVAKDIWLSRSPDHQRVPLG